MGLDFDFIHHKRSACLLLNKIIIGFLLFSVRQKMPLGKLHTLFLENEKQPSAKKKSEQCFTGKTKLARQYSAVCEHTEVKFIIFKHLFCFTSHKSKQSTCDPLDSSNGMEEESSRQSGTSENTREVLYKFWEEQPSTRSSFREFDAHLP